MSTGSSPITLPWGMKLPFILPFVVNSFAGNGTFYVPLISPNGNVQATQALTQLQLPFDFHIQQVQIRVDVNGKDGISIVNMMDDGAGVGAIVSVGIGATGLFESIILDVEIIRDSDINIRIETGASSAGNFAVRAGYVIGYIFAQDIGPVAR